MTEIRGRLKARRQNTELTCADVAKMVGVSEVTVYRWEAGDRTPDPVNLARWAHVLRVGFRGLLELADRHEDTSLWGVLVVGEHHRNFLDRTGTVQNRKHADAVRLADRLRPVTC
ncbi:helix-turn-helix domain-containing protein [Streptomyces formicae]